MDHEVVVALISSGIPDCSAPQQWADLGAGSGAFTKALLQLLPMGSTIFAVDKVSTPATETVVSGRIVEVCCDFVTDELPAKELDGVVMANAFHFVKDKPAFIKKLRTHIKPGGRLIMVEYDTVKTSPWIPYPISLKQLPEVMLYNGFSEVIPLHNVRSIYGDGQQIYSALVK